jgi:hypothetical protein
MAVHDHAQRVRHPGQLRRVQTVLRIGRRVPARQQHRIAFPQRHVEKVGKANDHPGGRAAAAGLDER